MFFFQQCTHVLLHHICKDLRQRIRTSLFRLCAIINRLFRSQAFHSCEHHPQGSRFLHAHLFHPATGAAVLCLRGDSINDLQGSMAVGFCLGECGCWFVAITGYASGFFACTTNFIPPKIKAWNSSAFGDFPLV